MNNFQIIDQAFQFAQNDRESHARLQRTYEASQTAYSQLAKRLRSGKNPPLPDYLWTFLESFKASDNPTASASWFLAGLIQGVETRQNKQSLQSDYSSFMTSLDALVSVSEEVLSLSSSSSQQVYSLPAEVKNRSDGSYLPAVARGSNDSTDTSGDLFATQVDLEKQLAELQESLIGFETNTTSVNDIRSDIYEVMAKVREKLNQLGEQIQRANIGRESNAQVEKMRQELNDVKEQNRALAIGMDHLKAEVARGVVKAMDSIAEQWAFAQQEHPAAVDPMIDEVSESASTNTRIEEFLKSAVSNISSNLEPLLIETCRLERLNIRVGEPYDGAFMLRSTDVPVDDSRLVGQVARVYTRGYKYAGGSVFNRALVDVFVLKQKGR
jgi:hypothetical protein